jgi:hypothetical protein
MIIISNHVYSSFLVLVEVKSLGKIVTVTYLYRPLTVNMIDRVIVTGSVSLIGIERPLEVGNDSSWNSSGNGNGFVCQIFIRKFDPQLYLILLLN